MTSNVIETTSLTKHFGDVTAVDNLELKVPLGSVYGFLGPNGAGKTTTIRLILGLIRPNQGEVRLFGMHATENRLSVMCRIGALAETPSYYPHLSGRENLEITRKLIGASKENIDTSLATVRLSESADRLVREYSLGMKQRLGLALALIGQPELLILDEPTNGLDPAGIQEIRELICTLALELGITIFLSSHLLGEVERTADTVGIINKGRLLFQGALSELDGCMIQSLEIGVNKPLLALGLIVDLGFLDVKLKNGLLQVRSCSRGDASIINAKLVNEGFDIYHLKLKRPSLEDIFFDLTMN